MNTSQHIKGTVTIQAKTSEVWKYLTQPELMKPWMGEEDLQIEIDTDWMVGHPITIRGFHYGAFVDRGTVLAFEPEKLLRYSHLSSVSRLPDKEENYTILEFHLAPDQNQTVLTVTITNFPTETIFKHLELYWRATLHVIKNHVEASQT